MLENLKGRNQYVDRDLPGSKILKWTLRTQDMWVRTVFVWIRLWTNAGLL